MGGVFSDLFQANQFQDVKIDLKNAVPPDQHKALYARIKKFLVECPVLLEDVDKYEDRTEYIRKALAEVSQENEDLAFKMVSMNVDVSARLYQASTELQAIVPAVFRALADTDEEKMPAVAQQQAICYQLTKVFDFLLSADELKMLRPGLQNDFAFYRRTLPKHTQDEDLPASDEDASFISMFLANSSPMMAAVCKGVVRACGEDEAIVQQVAHMANACLGLIKEKKADGLEKLCLRTMVGCIVLYDCVHPKGVFSKESPVKIKVAAQLLVRDFKKEYPDVDLTPLINVVKYCSPHYSDASTPDAITCLLEDG